MSRGNNLIVILFYNLLVFLVYFFSIRYLVVIPTEAKVFPFMNIIIVVLLTIFVVTLLTVAIKRFISSKDEDEQKRMRRMQLLISPLTGLMFIITFFLLY